MAHSVARMALSVAIAVPFAGLALLVTRSIPACLIVLVFAPFVEAMMMARRIPPSGLLRTAWREAIFTVLLLLVLFVGERVHAIPRI